MPPPLDELLSPSRLADADPYFEDYTVTGLPVCGAEDSPIDARRRILTSPDSETVYFPTSGDVSSETTFLNVDDATYRRIMTTTGGFVYNRTATGSGGREIPLGPGVAHLCRSEEGSEEGRYEIYISENAIANNAPGNPPALRRVPTPLAFDEIAAIVRSLRHADGSAFRLASDRYQVDPADPTQLSLMPDASEIEDIAEMVEAENSPIPEVRRAPIAAALRDMMSRESLQELSMREASEMRGEMRLQMVGMTLVSILGGIYTGLVISGKAGPIHSAMSSPFRGLFHLLRAPFDRAEGLTRFWNESTTGIRYRGIPTLLRVGTNMTEQARLGEFRPVADPTTPAVAEMIENTINSRFNTMSVLVEGPPGWGKEEIMRTLARRNPGTTYIRVTPNGMMGGTMYRGQLEERLNDIPREIARARASGQPVVLLVDEFHEALSAGRSMESTTSLLEHWKGELARGDIRIVGFSTPRELLKARYIAGIYNDPATRARLSPEFRAEVERFERDGVRQNLELRPLLNRFQPLPLPPRPATDIEAILRDTIAARRGSGLMIEMNDATLRRIAELSASSLASEGHIPRTALAIFNGVVDANTSGASPTVRVTADMIDGYVQTNYPDIAQRFHITGGTPPPPPAPPPATTVTAPVSPLTEVMTYSVNDTAIEAALRSADPALADYYRANISNTTTPVMTFGELAQRILAVDPAILSQATRALTAEGLSIVQAPERFIFEVVTRAAATRGGWSPSSPTELPARASAFETEVRRESGVERRGTASSEAERARREAEDRTRREAEARRP